MDVAELTNGANTVERQVIVVGDPSTAASVAGVVMGLYPAQGYQLSAACMVDGYKATYMSSFAAVSAGTSATTDFFTIFGSATKTLRVLQIGFGGTIATTAENWNVLIQKCSAVPSVASIVATTVVPLDSSDAAGTATTIGVWTTAPTAATYVGKIAAQNVFLSIAPAVTQSVVFNFGNLSGHAIVLRGIAQGVSLSFNAITPAHATSLSGYVLWTEE